MTNFQYPISKKILNWIPSRAGNDTRCGFTLIELLVTMGVIAVLSAGTMMLIGKGPRQAANDSKRKADMSKLATALETYRANNSVYPASLSILQTQNYISSIPTDPKTGAVYGPSNYTGGETSFTLCVDLEKIAGTGCDVVATNQ